MNGTLSDSRETRRPRLGRRLRAGGAARAGLRPELAGVAAQHRVAREAGELAVRAVAVEDALAIGVDDADGVGGVVEDGAEALALLRQQPALDDALHEQGEHRGGRRTVSRR